MKAVVVDTETTTFQKGGPFCDRNKLCYLGTYDGVSGRRWRLDGFGTPYGESIGEINDFLRAYDLLIGFNVKFDLHWIKRYGISFIGNVWDCQLTDFIIHGQSSPLSSLESVLLRLALPPKITTIAAKYWDKGIDTPQVPQEEMELYLENDCLTEWELYQWQIKYLEDMPKLKRLIWNACQDLKLTQEMEYNGILYDLEKSQELGDRKLERIGEIDRELNSIIGRNDINWNSGDQLSAVLYGGTIYINGTEQYTFTYKDGRTTEKCRSINVPITFNRLVEPLRNTSTAKDGFFFTNEGVLRKLKAVGKAKQIITFILERTKIETQVSRYLHGIPKLYKEMDWTNSLIHGQLQHAVTKTGRLASAKPNIQNLPPEALCLIKTRFQ